MPTSPGYTSNAEGSTNDFPTTPGAFDTTYNNVDAFVTKLTADGSALVFSTYLGGSGSAFGLGLAIDSAGHVYATGRAFDPNFPTTPGAFDTSWNGDDDIYVTKFTADGRALIYSTLIGGANADGGYDIDLDQAGNAYVAGRTRSANFPTTSGAFDTALGGSSDAIVAKLNSTRSDLLYSTFLGASGPDGLSGTGVGPSIVLDAKRGIYVSGVSGSTDFPVTAGAFQPAFGGGVYDAFVSKFAVRQRVPASAESI